jgi:ArsR family transcriptional regulator
MKGDVFYERQARICQVLADPKRLRLLDQLRGGERSVGELAGALGVTYPNASQHLNVMRDAGLVATRREGTTIYYRLAYPRIVEACDIVHEILRAQLAEAAALVDQARAQIREEAL